mgnify:FL=1
MWNAHCKTNGGVEVWTADRILDDIFTCLVSFSVDLAAFNTSACEEIGKGLGEVVSS